MLSSLGWGGNFVCIHLIHFHRDLGVVSVWKMLLCGLSHILCEQVWINRVTRKLSGFTLFPHLTSIFHKTVAGQVLADIK